MHMHYIIITNILIYKYANKAPGPDKTNKIIQLTITLLDVKLV